MPRVNIQEEPLLLVREFVGANRGSRQQSPSGRRPIETRRTVGHALARAHVKCRLPGSVVIDYNLVDHRTPASFATVRGAELQDLAQFLAATDQESHGIAADPAFRDPLMHDYRPKLESPVIDSGLEIAGVTDGFFGAAPDRGYVEAEANPGLPNI